MRLPQERTFFEHLIALQQHVGGTILVEGVPAAKTVRLAPGPPLATLSALAKEYDFSYQVENGIRSLVSRFQEPTSLPEVSATDFQASLRDILKVLKGLYRPPKETLVTEQIASLLNQTSPLLRGLAYGNQGLRFGQLPPELQERFTAIFLHQHYKGWIDHTAALERTLDTLEPAVIVALPDGSVILSGQMLSPPPSSADPLPSVDRRVDHASTPTLWTWRRYAAALGAPCFVRVRQCSR